ncbi:MAG: FG-GAP repeat domain-containing protein, partial [Candidatus Kapaibacteriota bacterium]
MTITAYPCVGFNPRAVTTGDVNNDGWQDIIAIDQIGTALVWLNNGSGGFGGVTTFGGLGNIISVISGDVDTDGDVDIIVGGSTGIRVLLNTGTGTFGSIVNIGGGFAAALADIDADGDVDILSANGSGGVNIFVNNGGGIFSASGTVPTGGTNNNNITVADIDNDGDVDIITGHDNMTSSVAVLLNNGAGSFAPAGYSPIAFPANSRPRSVSTADVDGDGDMDIVVALSDVHQVGVLINNGGGFTHASGSPYSVLGLTPWQVTTADFDGDGDID